MDASSAEGSFATDLDVWVAVLAWGARHIGSEATSAFESSIFPPKAGYCCGLSNDLYSKSNEEGSLV